MDEQRKNPYRRAPSPPVKDGERRPGLRQLPADLEDLALGKADYLPRPRREPNPLQDEREGAVIPGVRNADARTVYDARVASLRAAVAAGHEAELRAGLEEVRRLALWRARNVTDYRAFAESVVGVAPALAQALVDELSNDTAPKLEDHAVALAIRIEAAVVARDPSARVRVHADGPGVRLSVDVPVSDIGRAVETLTDVGRAAHGLRRFLRGFDAGGAFSESPAFDSRNGQRPDPRDGRRPERQQDGRRPERRESGGSRPPFRARRDDRRGPPAPSGPRNGPPKGRRP
ncbi:MAG: hypothetical protein RL701_3942 [Pseudomonadota bacterium]|jgi:hypothetical protein